jgi:SOS-response transcriptional repressor LexA
MSQLVEAVGMLTAKHGYPPTVRELAEEINVAPGRAATLAAEAERRGRLTRTPRVHRSLRVVEVEGRKRAHR